MRCYVNHKDRISKQGLAVYPEIPDLLEDHEVNVMDRALRDDELPYSIDILQTLMDSGSLKLKINLTNKGVGSWFALGEPDGSNWIRLSWRGLDKNKFPLNDFSERYNLPYDLPSGKSLPLTINIDSEKMKGVKYIEFSMVQETKFWFYSKGILDPIFEIPVNEKQ